MPPCIHRKQILYMLILHVSHFALIIHLTGSCSLIGPFHCHNTDDMLIITNPEVRKAFENFLLSSELDRTRVHLVLAGKLHTTV